MRACLAAAMSALWFIPHTHKLVIAGLLLVALVAVGLAIVGLTLARRRARRDGGKVLGPVSIRHGTGTEEREAGPSDRR